MSPLGSSIERCRARRSTNWRATISSTVLDALFSSMPWFCLSSWRTSWLVVPNSSAILKILTVANSHPWYNAFPCRQRPDLVRRVAARLR